MAHVAHLLVQAQINEGVSVWNGVDKKLSLKTLTFAAVMSVLGLEEFEAPNEQQGQKEARNKLMESIFSNTRNIIYGPDVVPRGYAYTDYIHAILKKVIPVLVKDNLNWWLGLFSGKISKQVLDLIQNTRMNPEMRLSVGGNLN